MEELLASGILRIVRGRRVQRHEILTG
jgi:hypothetical protein